MEYETMTVCSNGDAVEIPKMTITEVYKVMSSVRNEWRNLYLRRYKMKFRPSNPEFIDLGCVYLRAIYGVRVTDEKIFVLCHSGLLYIYYKQCEEVGIQFPTPSLSLLGILGTRFKIYWLHLKIGYYRLINKILLKTDDITAFLMEDVANDPFCRYMLLFILLAAFLLLTVLIGSLVL